MHSETKVPAKVKQHEESSRATEMSHPDVHEDFPWGHSAEPTGYGLGNSGCVSCKFGPKDDPPMLIIRNAIDESYCAIAPQKVERRDPHRPPERAVEGSGQEEDAGEDDHAREEDGAHQESSREERSGAEEGHRQEAVGRGGAPLIAAATYKHAWIPLALFAAACGTPSRTGPPIRPQCVVIADAGIAGRTAINGRAFGATRIGPEPAEFSPFVAMGGPTGAALTGLPDAYAMSEAWLRLPIGAKVFRGQVTPAKRILSGGNEDFENRAWRLDVQDAVLGWSPGSTTERSSLKLDGFGPDIQPEHMAPQILTVGSTVAEVFVCGGDRTNDREEQTTWLYRVNIPDGTNSLGLVPVQDLLLGDSIPMPRVNLFGVPTGGNLPDPVPSIAGPGAPVTNGWVKCVMTQTGDIVSTRLLHLVALKDKALYHAVLSDFGPVTQDGSTFSRFRSVSAWENLETSLGDDFGDFSSVAAAAQGPALQVFAIAKKSNVNRLWHTVRFPSGQWRAAHDVWKESGDAFGGVVYDYRVAAGVCPSPEVTTVGDQRNELVLALAGGPNNNEVLTMRVVREPRLWVDGVFPSVYSPWRSIPLGAMAPTNTTSFFVREATIGARPFLPSDTP